MSGDANFKLPIRFGPTYDDQRGGESGNKREVWIAMPLLLGNRTGTGDDLIDGATTPAMLRNQEDKNDVLFCGTVRFVNFA